MEDLFRGVGDPGFFEFLVELVDPGGSAAFDDDVKGRFFEMGGEFGCLGGEPVGFFAPCGREFGGDAVDVGLEVWAQIDGYAAACGAGFDDSAEQVVFWFPFAAAEWGVDGIRVNAVAPHAMSPGLQWWTENRPEEAAAFVKSIPLRRIGDCEEDIGRAIAWIVGDDARYLTGATVPLDGGQARWS